MTLLLLKQGIDGRALGVDLVELVKHLDHIVGIPSLAKVSELQKYCQDVVCASRGTGWGQGHGAGWRGGAGRG